MGKKKKGGALKEKRKMLKSIARIVEGLGLILLALAQFLKD